MLLLPPILHRQHAGCRRGRTVAIAHHHHANTTAAVAVDGTLVRGRMLICDHSARNLRSITVADCCNYTRTIPHGHDCCLSAAVVVRIRIQATDRYFTVTVWWLRCRRWHFVAVPKDTVHICQHIADAHSLRGCLCIFYGVCIGVGCEWKEWRYKTQWNKIMRSLCGRSNGSGVKLSWTLCFVPVSSNNLPSVGVGTCFSIFSFWLHVAAVTMTVAIIDWPEFDVLLMAL